MRLQIKEFAEFCNISVRALHLYDKMSLFKPSYIEPKNGYRYYDTEQMLELNTILSFKKVGFTLKEIKEMKEHTLSKKEVINRLQQKQKENERIIEIATYNNENISEMLRALEALKEQQREVKEELKQQGEEDKERLEKQSLETEALKISKIACLENEKLEHDFSQIIWL